MYARLLICALALSILFPAGEAQSSGVRVRIVPQYEEVALQPNQRGGVDMDVNFEVRTSCAAGTQFGVTIVFVTSFPAWAGASPEPANLQFDHDGGEATSRLTMFPAEDAPRGASVTYRMRPEVKLPPANNCTGALNVDSADANIKLTILGADQTGQVSTPPGDDGGRSPGFSALAAGGLLGALALLRRRL